MSELRIEHLTSPGIAEAMARGMRTAILPLGATEQHGAHLPLSVGSDHADRLGVLVAERLGDALVLPTVRIGTGARLGRCGRPRRDPRAPSSPGPRSTRLKLLDGSRVASEAARADVPGWWWMNRMTLISIGVHGSKAGSAGGRSCRPTAKTRSAGSWRLAASTSLMPRGCFPIAR
ncbi:creatininase family protein [Streptomyces demainii]|uniref:creatininase family protein n=1 Tax=Streptomyces demainii TaxID=588122 RepID=UPI00351C912D